MSAAEGHTTEVWFRLADRYIKELLETSANRLVWQRAYLDKNRIDPLKFASLWFPAAVSWRTLILDGDVAREYRTGSTSLTAPVAVYPVWRYGEDFEFLESAVANGWGDDADHCADESIPKMDRPVFGQEHRVIVDNIPLAQTGPGKRFLRQLAELQSEFPETMIHLHGLYGFQTAFGLGYNAVDMEPRTNAAKGKIEMPMGKVVSPEQASTTPQWVTLMGFSPVDLSVPRNRTIYNIKSALWAGEHYMSNFKFRTRGAPVDPDAPGGGSPTGGLVHSGKAVAGDKFLCDTCSLQDKCKYFRTGAVCSIPDSEPASLARTFMSRDAETIITGLGTVVAAQVRRAERGMEDEDDFGELSPEVTKILNSVFNNGVKLAKLLNPALNGGPRVGVFVNGAATVGVGAGAPSSPKQLIAGVVAELEARGIPRNKITPEMIENLLGGDDDKRQAIEATVTEEVA